MIISQADGGRYAAKADPAVALHTIADIGRDALEQMHRLLGVLRDYDAADTTSQSRLADISELGATMQLSRTDVDFHETGEATRQMAEGAELVLYRSTQEALINVAGHVGAVASATVTCTGGLPVFR